MADKLTLDRAAMRDRSTSHLRIYVGGISEYATVDDMYTHFTRYGQINGISLHKNFAFVQFENEKSAQDAIAKAGGSIMLGKTINVRTAQNNPEKRRDTEAVSVQPEVPAAAASENNPVQEDVVDEPYDNFGNYKDDFRDEDFDDPFKPTWEGQDERNDRRMRGRPRLRGRPPRGRGGIAGIRGGDYEPYPQMPEYPRTLPVPEKNDCEIIVVSKLLTEYAEYIESKLKHLGIVVDLLYPMEDVPIGKVLGNIASRGCLYAILVMPQNQEHRSLTLTILHGLPQEHRNMPLEDALQLLSRNFQEVQRGGVTGREAVYALLGQLADGRTLTVLQYDKVIEYLKERREQQVKLEVGEPLTKTAAPTKAEADLQQRILTILNDKKQAASTPAPALKTTQSQLLNDPSVKKALDSILQKFT